MHGSGHHGFTAHNAALIVLLVGVALLLGSDTAKPVYVRVPGLLILGVVLVWLVLSLRTRSERRG
jgi:hypothetical protein